MMRTEKRPRQPPSQYQSVFQEDWYVTHYPDVGAAISGGFRTSGWDHFLSHGYAEGRSGFPFDTDWYLKSYPLSVIEIRSGMVGNAVDHYVLLGSARGYLPHSKAERPLNAARLANTFGGLWIDFPNAGDSIDGKLEIGSITALEAESLRHFWRYGYAIIKSAIPKTLLEQARRDLERAYEGGYGDLKFECHSVARDHIPWRREINPFASKALDIHMFSGAIRDVIFSERVRRFLNLLFESQPMASQTLGFLRGSAQEAHQDSAYVAFTIPRQFAASWIALEDVSSDAGELFYYPRTHEFEDFLYAGKYKSVSEANRSGSDKDSLERQVVKHVSSLVERADSFKIEKETFLAEAGDALIWHADLAHGGLQVSKDVTRKSLVTHYCPRFLAPLFMEHGSMGYFPHYSGAFFTSGAYPNMMPLG